MFEVREMMEDEFCAILEKVFNEKIDEEKSRLGKHFTKLLKLTTLLDVEIYNISEHIEETKNNELAEWVESMRMWLAGMPSFPQLGKFEEKENNIEIGRR